MANKTIQQLTSLTEPAYDDTLAVYDTSANGTGKLTIGNITGMAMNNLGVKNLIPYPYYETSHVENGITWTDNGDGTITANGTTTAQASFDVKRLGQGISLPIGNYVLSGCPSGGSSSTYKIYVRNNAEAVGNDYGDGLSFEVSDATETYGIYIQILSNVTVSNLVFKPMLRLASNLDDTWQPYAATNATLTKQLNNDFLYAYDDDEPTGEVEFESADTTLTPSSSVSVDLLTGNDSWGQRFAKISQMFKNVRYLLGKLGTTDISTIGNGTVTDAINTINNKSFQIASLCIGETLTTTTTDYNTYNGRKFSDYDIFIFKIGANTNDCRRTVVLPAVEWNLNTRKITEVITHGTSLNQNSGIGINYVSDTSFSANISGTGTINYLEIYGIKF